MSPVTDAVATSFASEHTVRSSFRHFNAAQCCDRGGTVWRMSRMWVPMLLQQRLARRSSETTACSTHYRSQHNRYENAGAILNYCAAHRRCTEGDMPSDEKGPGFSGLPHSTAGEHDSSLDCKTNNTSHHLPAKPCVPVDINVSTISACLHCKLSTTETFTLVDYNLLNTVLCKFSAQLSHLSHFVMEARTYISFDVIDAVV